MKKMILILSVVSIVSLLACSPKEKQAATPGGLRVTIVTSSGVDDGSFGQDCYNGILDFLKTHPEARCIPVNEPDMSKVVQAVADVIADYDVLVLPGFQYAPAGYLALENPGKKLILVDTYPQDANGNEVELPNVYAMTFQEEQSGFFAGIAAALETKSNRIAFVGGMPFPPVVNYHFGFNSGVNYANAHYGTNATIVELPSYSGTDVRGIVVGGNYIGGFADEATGKVVGNALINQGVDIMFVAAGASGNGAFTAAKEASGVFVIGCDVDQYNDGAVGGRNIVLTSGLKVMNTNVAKQLTAIANGTFVGKNEVLSASTDSTGYVSAPGRHQMSASTLSRMSDAYALLKRGDIVPAANFNGHSPNNFPGLR
ncbi:MAG: BMP family ABC transporter substrate-binding protein [Treponema sp.]|jgi:basic membrane protein A|nr:BMP family ABC transporter substrate-binding protein [Treponema sp.]